MSREAILKKVRAALDARGDEAARRDAVSRRLAAAPAGVVPARGQRAEEERVALFCAMAEKVSATVERVETSAEVPEAVAAYLRARNLPATLRMGADERLAAMPWPKALIVETGPAGPQDAVGVSHALAGIAETATVALASGGDNPTTVNFLPEHHIVVVKVKDIAGDLETVLSRLRQDFGKGRMPRTLNLITGPSRSGDIEQTLLLGAHGPRALHLVVVDED